MKSEKRRTNKKQIGFGVPGFRFSGISAGIKGKGKPDLALIVSDRPATAVAVFTTNQLKAAPVIQGEKVIRRGKLQAVVVNSGNANAATGPVGIRHAFQTAEQAARLLGIRKDRVLVSSTGKIGVTLPIQKILKALPRSVAGLSARGMLHAAQAMRTTDAFPKIHQVQGKIGGRSFTIAGIAKGAGMIEPRMATMLAYIVTDLEAPRPILHRVFQKVVAATFNSITVDGDTSTNDTALLLANGASGIKLTSVSRQKFQAGLWEVCQNLAMQMVRDGEGATKVVTIHIVGAKNDKSAKQIAFSVARSPLVKTSFFGEDPNWGRVFAAVGYSGETFNPSRVDIFYGPIPLVKKGRPLAKGQEAKAHRVMKKANFTVTVDLHQGRGEAKVWASDLTYDYVKINAEYRT